MSYKKGILGDYIDILSGFAFKTKDFNYCGVPVIKIKNICPPYVCLNDLSYVTTELADKQNKFELKFNDVLIAMTGSHINRWESSVGRVARVRFRNRALLNQRVGKVVAKPDVDVCIDYIYYFLSQDKIRTELASKATGSANQANISPTHIKEIILDYVNVETQIKISHILSAYDNLIENNQKQIKLLEEAAQRLYKEWFIDLQFPGHENVEFVDGIPIDWQKGTLETFVDVIMGQSPKSIFYNQDGEGIAFHQGVGSYGDRFVIDSIYSTSITRIAEAGSILFSVRAPVGRLNITKNRIIIGRGLAALKQKNNYQSFLFYMLKEFFFRDNIVGNGSIFASITKNELLSLSFILPNEKLIKRFNDVAVSIDKKIEYLDIQIALLTEARDRLLPKLMSGEIEV